ncbi:MAG: HAD family hydrolase [Nitrospiraceae bacterium]|nr:MAG: HAD family hydrolase [Nitrospiraceae bacterium]
MIRAIIFDYGNVISRVDNNLFLKRLSASCEKSIAELHSLIYEDSGLPVQYETGLITSDEFYNRISELCLLKMKRPEFIRAFTDIFTPVEETARLIRKLKADYKIALLSNTNEWDFEYEIRKNKSFHLFDSVTLSFMVKEMKPGRKIYLDALGKLNLKPEECVYIDDIREYADAAAAVGIAAIHYISHEQLLKSLEELDVRI